MHAFYLNGGFVQFVALFVDALDKFPNYSRKAVSDELQNGFTQVLFYESMSRLVNRYEYGAPFKQGMQPGIDYLVKFALGVDRFSTPTFLIFLHSFFSLG